jgi:hypothetical protein
MESAARTLLITLLALAGPPGVAMASVNLIQNGGFDTDLSSWSNPNSFPAVWDPMDAIGAAGSGSARISNIVTPGNGGVLMVLHQCFPTDANTNVQFGGSVRIPAGQDERTAGYMVLFAMSEPNCSGDSIETSWLGGNAVEAWTARAGSYTTPAGTRGLRFSIGVLKDIGVTTLTTALFDDLFLFGAGDGTGFPIDHTLSGSWFNPATPGQGFFLDVSPALNLFFAGWYTWTATPGQYDWLTAQGNYSGDTALVPVARTVGGVFDSGTATNTTQVGWARFRFFGCSSGHVDIEFDDGHPNASIPLVRLTPPLPGCTD